MADSCGQRRVERRFQEERAAYDEMLSRLTMLYANGLLDVGLEPEVHADGASNLVGIDFQLNREKMRQDLFRTLEEKKRLKRCCL